MQGRKHNVMCCYKEIINDGLVWWGPIWSVVSVRTQKVIMNALHRSTKASIILNWLLFLVRSFEKFEKKKSNERSTFLLLTVMLYICGWGKILINISITTWGQRQLSKNSESLSLRMKFFRRGKIYNFHFGFLKVHYDRIQLLPSQECIEAYRGYQLPCLFCARQSVWNSMYLNWSFNTC